MMGRGLVMPLLLLVVSSALREQEYVVHAVDDQTNKSLSGIPITLRYGCGDTMPFHCRWITRKTGKDGMARFPEAGSLPSIDDIYSLPIAYATVADIQPKVFPETGTMRFRRRTLPQMIQWIVAGP